MYVRKKKMKSERVNWCMRLVKLSLSLPCPADCSKDEGEEEEQEEG